MGQNRGMAREQLRFLSTVFLVLGFGSIVASVLIWFLAGGNSNDPLVKAHAERFGLFVGLWAPTFFILSNRFDRYADKAEAPVDED